MCRMSLKTDGAVGGWEVFPKLPGLCSMSGPGETLAKKRGLGANSPFSCSVCKLRA